MLVDVTNLPLVAGHPALDLVNTVEPRIAGQEPERDHLADPAALLVWARRAGLADEAELAAVGDAWERDPGAAWMALDAVRDIREALYSALLGAMGLAPADAAEVGGALERLHSRWLAAVGRSTFRLEPGRPATGAGGTAGAVTTGAAAATSLTAAPRSTVATGAAGATSPTAATRSIVATGAADVTSATSPTGATGAAGAAGAVGAVPRLAIGLAPALLVPDRAADAAYNLLFTADLGRLGRCPTDQGGCGWLFLDHSRNRSRRWCRMADCGSEVKARRLTERRRQARSTTA